MSCFGEQISSSPAGGKWSGQFGSAGMLAKFLLSLSWTEGWTKGFLSAVLIVRCNLLLSSFVADANQTVMEFYFWPKMLPPRTNLDE